MKKTIQSISSPALALAALLLCTADLTAQAPKTGTEIYEFEQKMMILPPKADVEQLRRLGGEGLDELVAQFVSFRKQQIEKGTDSGAKLRLAVLPLQNDISDGYLTRRLEDLFSQQGGEIDCEVFTRDSDVMKAIFEEIAIGQARGDIMDESTIKRFGKVKGVDALVLAQAYQPKIEQTLTEMRIGLKVMGIEEARLIWGNDLTKSESRSLSLPELIEKYLAVIIIVGVLLVLLMIKRAIGKGISDGRRPR